jgi:catechol-2,3-dioxygenase
MRIILFHANTLAHDRRGGEMRESRPRLWTVQSSLHIGIIAKIARGVVMTGQPAKIIDPGVRIGHVHLKVADLERSLGFLSRCARL